MGLKFLKLPITRGHSNLYLEFTANILSLETIPAQNCKYNIWFNLRSNKDYVDTEDLLDKEVLNDMKENRPSKLKNKFRNIPHQMPRKNSHLTLCLVCSLLFKDIIPE